MKEEGLKKALHGDDDLRSTGDYQPKFLPSSKKKNLQSLPASKEELKEITRETARKLREQRYQKEL